MNLLVLWIIQRRRCKIRKGPVIRQKSTDCVKPHWNNDQNHQVMMFDTVIHLLNQFPSCKVTFSKYRICAQNCYGLGQIR